MSGQTLNDRLTAARHALAGQGLARIVCKATTEEVIGPKKKHLDYLIHCTNEPNVSIPQLANLLIERTQNASWVVVFKALITVHHLMCYGNERFTQYLASSNCTFQLGCFLDKVGVQSYDMSTFIRRYAKYLNEKAVSYRTVAFDFCKCKRGKEDGILRQMSIEQLLKTLPALQAQLDSLLEFDCSTNDLCNGVVNSCFMLLFRDLVRLFACYNDGIINLLGKYFEMNKKHARDALDIYKKFLIRMDRVAEFLKVAENIGIDKGDIPDLTKAPSSLLEALEQHLATLEGRKGSTSAASAAARVTNVQNAVLALSHTSNAFGSAGETSPQQEMNGGPKVDESVRKAVEEEAEIMTQLKFDHDSPLLWEQPAWEDSERRMKEMNASGDLTSPPAASAKTNPFLSSPCEPPAGSTPISNQKIIDLFNSPAVDAATIGGTTLASDDLLGLGSNNLSGNPFADSLFGVAPAQPQKQHSPQKEQHSFAAFTNGFGSSASDAFASDASFAAAFGDSPSAAADTDSTKLSLPVMEAFAGRSATPSPTTELMRGAGTTPILSHVPEGGFGGDAEAEAPPQAASDFIWGGTSKTSSAGSTPTRPPAPNTTAAVTEDFFGNAFEPSPSVPMAVVPPLAVQPPQPTPPPQAIPPPHAIPPPRPLPPPQQHQPPPRPPPPQEPMADLFGFGDGDVDFGEQPMATPQPCPAPPPSPFGGFDIGVSAAPDLRAQAIANAVGVALPMQAQPKPPPPSSGLEDLDFAGLSPVLAASPIPSGYGYPSGIPGPMIPPMQGAGTPTGRTSSTPGYGTPPSGMSSPAKSFGAPAAAGAFDAFGDTLLPQSQVPVSKPAPVQQHTGGSSSILKGDLDSTLANLACNLDINGPKNQMKRGGGHQWGSPKPPVKAGPPGQWTAPAAVVPGAPAPNVGWSASPQHAYQQMGAAPPAGQWGGMMAGGYQQQPQPGVYQQQQPPFVARPGAPMAPMGQPPFAAGGFAPQAPLMQPAAPPNDPFGAL